MGNLMLFRYAATFAVVSLTVAHAQNVAPTGLVTDAKTLAPMANATVMFTLLDSGIQIPTVTDANGRFELPPQSQPGVISISAPGFVLLRRPWSPTQPKTIAARLYKPSTLTGIVMNASGNAVDGIVTAASERYAAVLNSAITVGGRFVLRGMPEGGAHLVVRSDGLAPVVSRIDVDSPQRDLRFVLEPEYLIRGRVVDRAGVPLEGAMVRVSYATGVPYREMLNEIIVGSKWTDGEGRFELRGLVPNAQLVLRAFKGQVTSEEIRVASALRSSNDIVTLQAE